MDRRRTGYLLAGLGALLLVVSAAADPLGIGEGGGIGWKQVVGMLVGAALVLGGVVLSRRSADVPASES